MYNCSWSKDFLKATSSSSTMYNFGFLGDLVIRHSFITVDIGIWEKGFSPVSSKYLIIIIIYLLILHVLHVQMLTRALQYNNYLTVHTQIRKKNYIVHFITINNEEEKN